LDDTKFIFGKSNLSQVASQDALMSVPAGSN